MAKINHRVVQPAGGAHDRHRAVTQAVKLVQAARLEAGRHHKKIAAGLDAVRQAGVVADLHGDLFRVAPGQAAHRLLEQRIAAAQPGKLKRRPAAEQCLQRAEQNIDPLLIGETADVAEQRHVVEFRQAKLALQRKLVERLAVGRVGGIGGCEVRIVGRVPLGVIDAVKHAGQRTTSGLEHPLEAAAVFLRQQFAGVARAHGGDKVGEHDAALQEADAAMKLKLPPVKKRFRQAG